MSSWHSYPKVYALGHAAIADLLLDPVLVQEKIDGSQFSFGRFDGELRCRSRGAALNVLAPDNMFKRAVEVAGALDLHDGWTYRGEYLAKPKHNALAYGRVPAQNIILFDVNVGQEVYLSFAALRHEATRLGFEVVPALYEGVITDAQLCRDLLARDSVLGDQKVEGVVVKNYARFGVDGHVLMGKFVSEAFKEVHAREWADAKPGQGDIIARLTEAYRTPARWAKAVQHMQEVGALAHEPKDIGALVQAVPADVEHECGAEIQDALWQWAWPQIKRGLTRGLAEWYKERLLERQFEPEHGGDAGQA